MGTISDKLTYLNTTKTMLRDSLNKFGSNILTNDTFRSYDTKLNDIYDKLPKITQSGAGLTISNVQNGQVDDFKMIGVDLEQDTTNGNQLIDFGNVTTDNPNITWSFNNNILQLTGESRTYVGIQYDVSSIIKNSNNSGKTIKFGYKTISNITGVGNIVQLNTYYNDGTANQYLSLVNREGTLMNTYTIPNDTSNIKDAYLVIYTNNNYQASTGSVTIEEPLLYFDNNNTYEPYTGGIASPNPDYPQEIKVVEGRQVINDNGKNKFYLNNNYSANYDEASIEVNNNNSFILRMNKTSSNAQSPCATIEFNASYLKPNTTYTISKKNSNTGYVLDHVGSIRLYTNGSYGNFIDADEYTFTTPNEITSFKILLYLFFNNSTTGNYEITFYDIQLEENSTATDYEPYYNPATYNIDLNLENIYLAKIPDTNYKNRIYKNNGNWYFEENVKKVILDGSEEITYQNEVNNIVGFRITTLNQVKVSTDVYCNRFKKDIFDNYWSNRKYGRILTHNTTIVSNVYCTSPNSLISTIEQFKNWLQNNNTYFYYILATPVTTQITNTTLINQLEAISVHTGTNIITISNSNNIIPEIEITRLKELEKLA